MKPEILRSALEDAATRLGLAVRWEKGHFRGGRCTVHGEDVIILNRQHPVETHLVILAECLKDCALDSIFIRPSVREAIEVLLSGQASEQGQRNIGEAPCA